MNPFRKLFSHEESDASSLDNESLIIPRQSLNKILTLCMLMLFGIFITGYFLGKRKATELFTRRLEQESASDKINLSLANVYDRFQKRENDEGFKEIPVESFEEIDINSPASVADVKKALQGDSAPMVRYQAQLLGGTSAMVQQFVDRLAKKGITIIARKRSSKTAQGKIMYWHQAVTPVMSDRADVEAFVERIKKLEKIDGIRIVEIKN